MLFKNLYYGIEISCSRCISTTSSIKLHDSLNITRLLKAHFKGTMFNISEDLLTEM